MLVDDLVTGDFRGKPLDPAIDDDPLFGTCLLIDRNGDGKFHQYSETFNAARPFNINGVTWEITDLTADGSFKIVRSTKSVAEIPLPPDFAVAKKIRPFKATQIDGAEVNFPGDYKGKIVMLDYWATWCGPCMNEVPNLVKTYNGAHPGGLEILGVSLDRTNAADKVKKVISEKGMTWPQICDGKGWRAAIAELNDIQSIPSAFLVDGDTGEILAMGHSLRDTSLTPTIEAALAKKTGK